MKKTLKLIMAIVLFIAVIAIANCVSAANLSTLASEGKFEVSTDGEVKTYKVTESFADNTDIDVRESNVILDLGSKAVKNITVYGKNVRIKEGNSIQKIEIVAGGELVRKEEDTGVPMPTTLPVVNKGTLIMEKTRNYDKVENSGTLVVKEGATVKDLIMRAGTATVEGTVTTLSKMEAGSLIVKKGGNVTIASMKDGKVTVEKGATFDVTAGKFEGGMIQCEEEKINGADIADKEKYIWVCTEVKAGENATYYILPKEALQVAVKFEDIETGEYVTNLKAGKVYQVSAEVIYDGVKVINDKWNGYTFTSKDNSVLMAVTEHENEQFRAEKDGVVALEVKVNASAENRDFTREVSVTVGEVKNDEPENEPEGNQPSENKGELDSTPKTGDYCRHGSSNISSR